MPKEIDEVKADANPEDPLDHGEVHKIAKNSYEEHDDAEDDVKADRPDDEGEHRTSESSMLPPFDGGGIMNRWKTAEQRNP